MWILRKAFRSLLRRANAARDQRRWATAAQAYRQYLRFVPSNGPIWVQLGNCLKEAGRFAEAGLAYERAQERLPNDADIHLQIGHLAKLMGRIDDAAEAFRRTVEIDPLYGNAAEELKNLGGVKQLRHGLVRPDRDRAANKSEARKDRERVARSERIISDFLRRLPSGDGDSPSRSIPKIFHFVFGFKDNGDIPYYGYMAIRSALHFNPGWKAYYYTMHEPSGKNWDKIRDNVTVVLIEDFEYFGNSKLHHYAHKSDIIRMLVLANVGGVYLDIDSITRRSFDDLLEHDFVMGVQAAGSDSSSGLCNAIMLGKANAPFIRRWLAEYDYFRSKGRDDLWDYHSVKLPVKLATEHPEEITVLGYRAFFFPLWASIDRALFSEGSAVFRSEFELAYCFHLWNGATGSWLEEVDDEYVATSKSIYAEIAREVEGRSRVETLQSAAKEEVGS